MSVDMRHPNERRKPPLNNRVAPVMRMTPLLKAGNPVAPTDVFSGVSQQVVLPENELPVLRVQIPSARDYASGGETWQTQAPKFQTSLPSGSSVLLTAARRCICSPPPLGIERCRRGGQHILRG